MRPTEAAAIGVSVAILGAVLLTSSGTRSRDRLFSETELTKAPADQAPATERASLATVAAQPLVVPQTDGPITYYTTYCARCHGDASAAYQGVTHPKHGAELRQVIKDMAEGPGATTIDAKQLDDQVTLHEAMFDHKPYAWIDPNYTDGIAGEKLENTVVTLTFGGKTISPAVDEYRFALPKSSAMPNIRSR